jgi:hypothetical protein
MFREPNIKKKDVREQLLYKKNGQKHIMRYHFPSHGFENNQKRVYLMWKDNRSKSTSHPPKTSEYASGVGP